MQNIACGKMHHFGESSDDFGETEQVFNCKSSYLDKNSRPCPALSKKSNSGHPLQKVLPPGLRQDEQINEESKIAPEEVIGGDKKLAPELVKIPSQSHANVEPKVQPSQISTKSLGPRPKVDLNTPVDLRRSSRKKTGPVKYPK